MKNSQRKASFFVIVILIICACVCLSGCSEFLAFVNDSADSNSQSKTSTNVTNNKYIGDTVTSGKFSCTVQSVEPFSSNGANYLMIGCQIKNVSNSVATIDVGDFKLHSGSSTYKLNSEHTYINNSPEVASGASRVVIFYYEVSDFDREYVLEFDTSILAEDCRIILTDKPTV